MINNTSGEEVPRSDTLRVEGTVIHELGKVNGSLGKVVKKEASLADNCLRNPTAPSDTEMAMQWEKADKEKTEPLFKYKLAPNESSKQACLEEGMSGPEMGPMAMSFDQNLGWVAEKRGPISKHWKRLARKNKSNAPKKTQAQQN